MTAAVTLGVKVSVETFYQAQYSNPIVGEFMFAYRISIENSNEFEVQLLKRHWTIVDSSGEKREVKGDGVVGKQPVLKPEQRHQYVSGCNMKTEIGQMFGTYTFIKTSSGEVFEVEIPHFLLVAPAKLN